MKRNLFSFSGFILKIVAIISMTFDHVGVFLNTLSTSSVFGSDIYYTISFLFRIIGRISFPIFIFLLVEGIRHTKNVYKYLFRLGIMMLIIMIPEALIYHLFTTSIENAYSPFVDIFIIALILMLLNLKNKYSYLSIIPIAYILFTFVIQIYENTPIDGYFNKILWLPFYVRPGYSLFGLLLAIGFYYSKPLTNYLLKKKNNINDEQIELIQDTKEYHMMVNSYNLSTLIIVNLLIFVLGRFIFINNYHILDIYNYSLQNYSILSGLLLIFYNGQRGYNKKWFQYGCYIYFPMHIIILFLIFNVLL